MIRALPAGVPGAGTADAVRVEGSLWLICAGVPLEIYGASALEPRLRDLDWVAGAAMSHEAVIEHFARRRGVVVLPMKLFTMFSTRARAVRNVARRRSAILKAMRRIAGCEEWGVRVARAPERAEIGVRPQDVPAAGTARSSSADAGAGAAFLSARKAARDRLATVRAEVAAAADRAYGRLARVAKAAERRPRRSEPGTNPPVLEAAFLVPIGARTRFKAEARKQAAACTVAGGDMTLTGPWPAYSFVDVT